MTNNIFVYFSNTLVITIANVLTSIFAGFVIFAYLGYLSYITGQDVEDVVSEGESYCINLLLTQLISSSGPGLAFVVYPYAVTTLPAAPLWSILFFFMLILLGLDSVVCCHEPRIIQNRSAIFSLPV